MVIYLGCRFEGKLERVRRSNSRPYEQREDRIKQTLRGDIYLKKSKRQEERGAR
jgi:shikimate kinase